MRRGVASFIAVVLLLLSAGACARRAPETFDYGSLGKAVRLANGSVDVVIVPSVGRVMRYGFIDGPNLLFEDPAHRGKAPNGKFISWGGDKAWLWPQSDWPAMIRRSFPPPLAVDGKPWTLQILSPLSVRLSSEVIEPWGVRIVRDFSLDARGTRLSCTSRLLKIDDRPMPPTAAWTVTQVPAAEHVWVRGVGDGSKAVPYRPMMTQPWAAIEQRGRWLHLRRDPHSLSKTGIFGDRIVVDIGQTRFIQTVTAASQTGTRLDTDQAQVFSFPDPGGDHPNQAPYTELEFTSPRLDVATAGTNVWLTVQWELSPAAGPPVD